MSGVVSQVVLSVPDVSCAHCVAAVQDAVGGLRGVDSVAVDLASKQVEVGFQPDVVNLTEIRQALDDAGYPVAS